MATSFFKSFGITSGTAALGILVHSLATKVFTTTVFRLNLTASSSIVPDAVREKVESSLIWKRWNAAQINEAEYVGTFLPILLYLDVKGVDAPLASGLALAGQILYFWPRVLVGHPQEGGIFPPPYVPGALMRYMALGLLSKEIYSTTVK